MNKIILWIVLAAVAAAGIWYAASYGQEGDGASKENPVPTDKAVNQDDGAIDLVRPPFLDE